MYTVLSSTSETLAAHLLAALSDTEGDLGDDFEAGDMVVSLNTPEEMSDLGFEGLSVWLYLVVRDDQRLNAPPRRVAAEQWHRSLPLRLHYLMTPIMERSTDQSPQTEQLILGRVLQALHDTPTFRGAQLLGDLAGTDTELRARLEPVSLEEVTRIWDALGTPYQLSVSYEVTVAYVESARVPRSAAEVAEAMAVNAGAGRGIGVIVADDGGGGR